MPKYPLAVFDLDGTLLNTYPGVRAGVVEVIRRHRLQPLPEETLRTFVGPPIYVSLMRHYGVDEQTAKAWQEDFRNFYVSNGLLQASVYDGMLETLQKLQQRGVKTSVATYKREDMAQKVLEHFGLATYLDGIYGSDAANTRTKSDIIRMAIASSGITNFEDALMIGDTDNDARGAAEIGVPFLAVSYGFGFHEPADVEEFPHVGLAQTPQGILTYFE